MLCKDITNVIEQVYPKEAALDWDNVGLLVGRRDKEVKKVLLALDVTEQAIEEAIALDADMIITHHPLLFHPLNKVTDENLAGAKVLKLIGNDISYYAMHTNYDVLRMGDLLSERLDIYSVETLEVIDENTKDGIGVVGMSNTQMTLEEYARFVKKELELPNVKVFGNSAKKVNRVAISPGAGKGMKEHAIAAGADLLVTGDIDHHEGLDAIEQGIAVIDAGHYGTEYLFMEDMKKFLEEHFDSLKVHVYNQGSPFSVI